MRIENSGLIRTAEFLDSCFEKFDFQLGALQRLLEALPLGLQLGGRNSAGRRGGTTAGFHAQTSHGNSRRNGLPLKPAFCSFAHKPEIG